MPDNLYTQPLISIVVFSLSKLGLYPFVELPVYPTKNMSGWLRTVVDCCTAVPQVTGSLMITTSESMTLLESFFIRIEHFDVGIKFLSVSQFVFNHLNNIKLFGILE